MLEWHYRSQCEELIAFSNRYIYGDRLVTFPNPSPSNCISHVLVPLVPGKDGQEESASQEVLSVVDLVLEHAANFPDQTLGVITMGIKHQQRVEILRFGNDLQQYAGVALVPAMYGARWSNWHE